MFVLSILNDFFIPCVIRLILSCPPVMCSFIKYALYCILQLHSDRFLNPMCLTLYDIMFTRMCSFIQGVLFLFFSYPFGMLSPFRCIYALHYQDNLWCVLLSYVSHVLLCLVHGHCFFIRFVICFILSCPLR